jgi:hypothetical protein
MQAAMNNVPTPGQPWLSFSPISGNIAALAK